jgi:ferredoxin
MARISFPRLGRTIELDPSEGPFSGRGRTSSLLDIASAYGVELSADCGGVCLCVTCGVRVISGGDHLSPAEEKEKKRLERFPGDARAGLRLACQAVVRSDEADIVLELPEGRVPA